MPPGRPPPGTRNATASRKTFPASPAGGTFVDQAPATKSVVARARPGTNVMVAEGTGMTKGVPFALKVIGIGTKLREVGCCEFSPWTLSTLLNQTYSPSPPGIGVPLKFALIAQPDCVCANTSFMVAALASTPAPAPMTDLVRNLRRENSVISCLQSVLVQGACHTARCGVVF